MCLLRLHLKVGLRELKSVLRHEDEEDVPELPLELRAAHAPLVRALLRGGKMYAKVRKY